MSARSRRSTRLGWLARALAGITQALALPSLPSAYAQTAVFGPPREAAPASTDAAGAVRADAAELLEQGRRLLQAHQYAAAADKLRQASVRAAEQGLPAETRALMYYVLGLAERGAKHDDASILAFRQALKLGPSHPEFRLDLARAFLRNGQPLDAREEAEHLLLLGFSDQSEQVDAKALLKSARAAALRERFSAYVALSFGYDSNVLVGTTGPCSEADCTGTTSFPASIANLPQVKLLWTSSTDKAGLTQLYMTPLTRNEWDLPATGEVELSVRAYGRKTVNVWYEYRFSQYLLSSLAYNHDSYNFQEHSLPIYVLWKPASWLLVHPQVEGFVNFTGLRSFSPFQAGFRGLLDLAFSESERWTTRLLYLNQYRRSFDRANAAYLDGDRSDLKVVQELRLIGKSVRLRAQLSYRFRSEGSGVYDTRVPNPDNPVPLVIPTLPHGAAPAPLQTLGAVDYVEPTGYLGHEVATRWRLYVPAGFVFSTGVSYERRSYDATTTAPVFHYPQEAMQLKTFTLPVQQRTDSQIGFDFGIRKQLGRGFAIDCTYALMQNYSTLANWLDNRNFTKHTAVTTLSFTF